MRFVENFILILSFIGIAMAGMSKSFENSKESIQMETNENDCTLGCPRILDPICAVDDEKHPKEYKYFHNQCLMEYDSCRQSRGKSILTICLSIRNIKSKCLKCVYVTLVVVLFRCSVVLSLETHTDAFVH